MACRHNIEPCWQSEVVGVQPITAIHLGRAFPAKMGSCTSGPKAHGIFAVPNNGHGAQPLGHSGGSARRRRMNEHVRWVRSSRPAGKTRAWR